jgi:aldehyde dehydrogenase (NAD+)
VNSDQLPAINHPQSAINHPDGQQPALDGHLPPVDRTAKLFINGKQARPDNGYSLIVCDPHGKPIAEVGAGNRKDIRNAVEAARAALIGWAKTTGHQRRRSSTISEKI